MTPTTIEFLEAEANRGRERIEHSRQELRNLQSQRAELIEVQKAEMAELDEKIEPVRLRLAEREKKLAALEQDLEEGRNPPSVIVSHGKPIKNETVG